MTTLQIERLADLPLAIHWQIDKLAIAIEKRSLTYWKKSN